MANLTIATPDEILKSARQRARGQGTSVNAVLRDYLRQFAGAQASAAQRVLELSKAARSGRGKTMWTRDGLHER